MHNIVQKNKKSGSAQYFRECKLFDIVLEHFLCIRKLRVMWLPRLLIVDKKEQRVDDSEHSLKLFSIIILADMEAIIFFY